MDTTNDENSFLADESDSDCSVEDLQKEYDRSRLSGPSNFVDESEQEGSSTGVDSHRSSVASSVSGSVPEGRITPSIAKAIRRSIHQFSRRTSDDDNDSSEGTESDFDDDGEVILKSGKGRKKHIVIDDSSDEEDNISAENTVHSIQDSESSDEQSSKKAPNSNRKKRIVSDDETSDDEYPPEKEQSIGSIGKSSISEKKKRQGYRDLSNAPSNSDDSDQSNVDNNESKSLIEDSFVGELEPKVSTRSVSPADIEILDVPKKEHVVHVLSSSDEDLDTTVAQSIAKAETMNASINPMTAQQQALLVYKKQNIETQLAKAKMIFQTGNMDLLPDGGERLRLSIADHEEQLAAVKKELKTIQLGLIEENAKTNNSLISPKIERPERAPLFKSDSLEVDPTYLRPTTQTEDQKLGRKAQETMQREQALTVERLQDLHGSLLARPAENERAKDPRGLKVPLMGHQQHALAWLIWRERQKPAGGVLADDMGLGKTLTMIALVMASLAKHDDNEDDWQSSHRVERHLGGTLVVAPASLVAQWEAEVNNRCKRGLLSVELYHGTNRDKVPKRLAKNDMVVTTYNILSREFKSSGVLYKIRWRRVILDEAHVIRNHKSQTCEAVCGLQANKRWALTGTPIHNKEMDLYSILKFLQCSPFDDVRVWKRWVDNKNAAGHERLATVMKSLMLRRTKAELQAKGELESMPDKSIEVIRVTLDPDERLVYDKVMVYSRTLFAQFLAQRAEKNHMFELGSGKYDKPSWMTTYKETQFTKAQNQLLSLHADVQSHEILVLLLRLRQVCCHPSLINAMLDKEDIEQTALEDGGADVDLMSKMDKLKLESGNEGDIGVDERVSEHLLTSENPVFNIKRQSSKMRAVLEKVQEIMDKRDKLIIVSQWVGVLNVVANELDSVKGASYRMFTGQVAVKDRQGIMDDFNSSRAEPNILLLSLTAGGVGLNLVGANHLLLIDIHWNPQLESQAQDRIYRFGQKKNVFIYKYICEDTIEERIQGLQERKLELANSVLSGGGSVAGSKLSLDDIKSLFSL